METTLSTLSPFSLTSCEMRTSRYWLHIRLQSLFHRSVGSVCVFSTRHPVNSELASCAMLRLTLSRSRPLPHFDCRAHPAWQCSSLVLLFILNCLLKSLSNKYSISKQRKGNNTCRCILWANRVIGFAGGAIIASVVVSYANRLTLAITTLRSRPRYSSQVPLMIRVYVKVGLFVCFLNTHLS